MVCFLCCSAAASARDRATRRMSWFNASQLSSFAKQALSQAQKSIDRVLDIQAEESPWPDAVIPDYGDGKRGRRRAAFAVPSAPRVGRAEPPRLTASRPALAAELAGAAPSPHPPPPPSVSPP